MVSYRLEVNNIERSMAELSRSWGVFHFSRNEQLCSLQKILMRRATNKLFHAQIQIFDSSDDINNIYFIWAWSGKHTGLLVSESE